MNEDDFVEEVPFSEQGSTQIEPTFRSDVVLTCLVKLAIHDKGLTKTSRQVFEMLPILLLVRSQIPILSA